MASTSRRVLIVGGGPTGAVAAFWLAKAGWEVVVAERATERFTYGQGIDITGPAVKIVQKMGLMDEIKAKQTHEGGFALLNDKSETIAALGTAGDEGGKTLSLTQEIEIMRGDLTRILADAADAHENVTYRYGCTVTDIRQNEKHVTAVLSDTDKAEDFAAIIGGDGLGSQVRKMAFPPEQVKDCISDRGQFVGFFSMKGEPEDAPNSRWQHWTRGRTILVRPVDGVSEKNPTISSGYAILTGKSEKLDRVARASVEEQRKAMVEEFEGFPGPLGKRVVHEMATAKDFYFARAAQVKLPKWNNGRVALTGDAAYAPSGQTGQGTSLAIVGGYMIAGELGSNPDDPQAAFEAYEQKLRPYVEKLQQIPFKGEAPKLINPQSYFGITLLRSVFWFVSFSGLWKVFNVQQDKSYDLPEYAF